tara:strand:+ start:2638 stop:2805 length:168 start_codon:yes stop_codon:yes gene_type:complete
MNERFKQKELVFEKWNELIVELDKYLNQSKKVGGTLSHKVGSMRDKQIKMRDNFK